MTKKKNKWAHLPVCTHCGCRVAEGYELVINGRTYHYRCGMEFAVLDEYADGGGI